MITIHHSGIRALLSDRQIGNLIREFQENHFIRLRNLVDESLLNELFDQMNGANWENRVHDGIGIEVCLADAGLVALFNFLMNDQELFQLIQQITNCGFIGCFQGRIYRMIPSEGHYDSWHTDVGEDRLLALSLNLGKEIHEGGVLQIRSKDSERLIEAPNPSFGDAVLFRLSPALKHRVTNVTGNQPKTAFAGWFKSSPDLYSTLTELAQSNPPAS